MEIGKPITETPKEVGNFKRRFLFSFQTEVDKAHCMFWNFTIKYVKGVIYFVLPLSLKGFLQLLGQLSSWSYSLPVPLLHDSTRKCNTEKSSHGLFTAARLSFRFEVSQQHRVTKNNVSFLYEILPWVDRSE